MCRRMTSNPNAAIWSYEFYTESMYTMHDARYNHNIVGFLFDLNLDHRFFFVFIHLEFLALNLIFFVFPNQRLFNFEKIEEWEKRLILFTLYQMHLMCFLWECSCFFFRSLNFICSAKYMTWTCFDSTVERRSVSIGQKKKNAKWKDRSQFFISIFTQHVTLNLNQ